MEGNYPGKSIYGFGFPDGGGPSDPVGTVLVDSAGNIYGATASGGANQQGTVYELAFQQNGKYAATVLYSFQGKDDGGFPTSPVVMDASGNLYDSRVQAEPSAEEWYLS
jgi:uncharacterized repeat protein (TIGR03803 family)